MYTYTRIYVHTSISCEEHTTNIKITHHAEQSGSNSSPFHLRHSHYCILGILFWLWCTGHPSQTMRSWGRSTKMSWYSQRLGHIHKCTCPTACTVHPLAIQKGRGWLKNELLCITTRKLVPLAQHNDPAYQLPPMDTHDRTCWIHTHTCTTPPSSTHHRWYWSLSWYAYM